MSKLIVAACSYGKFGSSIEVLPGCDTKNQWRDSRSFPDILSQKLELELNNISRDGSNNDLIFSDFLNYASKANISESDIILIQWTHLERAWHETRISLLPSLAETNSTAREYFSFMFNEHHQTNKILSYSITIRNMFPKNEIFFAFAVGKNIINNNADAQLIKLFNTTCIDITLFDDFYTTYIYETYEGAANFKCYHPNELGHNIIADLYYEKLNKYTYDKNCNI